MENIEEKMSKHLDNLLSDTNVEQTTEKIRELRHSSNIKECVTGILNIKKEYSRLSFSQKEEIAKSRFSFLFIHYENIFNKVLKDEIDISLLFKFISILEKIENGILNQHEASFQVGTILKNIYIDSNNKRNEKLDKKDIKRKKQKEKKLNKKLSFEEWSKTNCPT